VPQPFDAAWRALALQGDAEAARQLAQANLEPLYRFCFYRLGGSRHLCEEAVQETLLRAIRELDRYDPQRCGNNVFGWLSGLARNETRRVLGRERSGISLDALWSRVDEELWAIFERLESEPLADDVLQREETRELVGATMSQLPTHYRAALEQKYVAGLSVREMASARAVSEKSMESLLARARRAFRETFRALSRNLGTEAM
jgi:RNA polymerase sigma-70 factor (ECF subfamily)